MNKDRIIFVLFSFVLLLCLGLLAIQTVNADSKLDVRTFGPVSSVDCDNVSGNTYYYSLACSDVAAISPGDTLSFKGSGIKGGQAEGDAEKKEFGGWKISFSGEEEVIFEATNEVRFHKETVIPGFVIQAKENTKTGQIKYKANGGWIGNFGNVPGPVVM